MSPRLLPGLFVFVFIPESRDVPADLRPVMVFREDEGTTLIVDSAAAQAAGLAGSFPCRVITLSVHSSLEAVGFLAAVLSVLAAAGISANAVSAYHHDHLFVPPERAEEALALLEAMSPRD